MRFYNELLLFFLSKEDFAIKPYKSIKERATAEFVEKKSQFISSACPVESTEQALTFISEIRALHPRATHNVWAYNLRMDNTARFSDDGEPAGTAGLPTLEVIKKQELIDVAVVTTRYFGSIMLGAAGLLRAYSHSAKLALDIAGILLYDIFCDILLECNYSDYQKIITTLDGYNLRVFETVFGESVMLTLRIAKSEYIQFCTDITELSNGRAGVLLIEEKLDCL